MDLSRRGDDGPHDHGLPPVPIEVVLPEAGTMKSTCPVVIGISHQQPAAVRFALAEARSRGVSLQVVHCHEANLVKSDRSREGELTPTATGSIALSDAHELIKREAPQQAVTYIEVEGRASEVLPGYAKKASTIVLGAGAASWLDWVHGGTVSGSVIRSSSCPVVSVPERGDSRDERGAVVVMVSGDHAADGKLGYGFEQAQWRDTTLIVKHAVPVGASDTEFDSHCVNIAELVSGWRVLFPDVEVMVSSETGDPIDMCVRASNSASLVVVGQPRGRVGSLAFARPLAMSVMRRAQCPVAIVDPDDRHDCSTGSTHPDLQSIFV